MSELPDLPPAPRHTRPVPAGGLAAAVAAGRRRRARFAAGAGAGTALTALVLVGLLSVSATQSDSLRTASPGPQASPSLVVPDPSARAEPSPEPTPSDGSGAAPGPGSAGGASPEPGRPASGAASGAAAAPAAPAPGGAAAAPPPEGQRPAYVERTDEDAAGSGVCSAFRSGPGACSYSDDSGPAVRRGTPVVIVQGACTGPDGAGDNVDVFAGGQETELVVRRDGGPEVFRFSSTVRYVQGPHERRLRPGRCLEYRQVWDGVDAAGRPVPAGEYELEMTVLPDREWYEFEDGTRYEDRKGISRTSTSRVRLVD